MSTSEKFKPEKPNTKPVCIIPARGGSKRIKDKNKIRFGGKTLVEHAILTAMSSNLFQMICVSSDDEEILETAYKYFNHGLVQPNKRPERMARDDVPLKEVCMHVLQCYQTSATDFSLLIPNNPFRTPEDLRKAYKLFKKKDANYLLSVKKYDTPPQYAMSVTDGFLVNWGEATQNSQELEPLYYEDGSICFAKIRTFVEEFSLNFHGSRCLPYKLPYPTIDIDTKEDLVCARYLWEEFKR